MMAAVPTFQVGLVNAAFQEAASAGFPDSEPTQRFFIITGPPRTGTSLVAGLLYHSGVHLGTDLVGEVAFNEKGLFEDDLFVKLNDMILQSAGGHMLLPPDPELFSNHSMAEALQGLFQYNARQAWGLKDGRFCLLAPVYDPHWEPLFPHFIVCHRDPHAVAQSLRRWWDIPLGWGLRVVAAYEDRLAQYLNFRADFPRLHVSYDRMLTDTAAQVERVARFCGIEIPQEMAAEFVDPGLKHY